MAVVPRSNGALHTLYALCGGILRYGARLAGAIALASLAQAEGQVRPDPEPSGTVPALALARGVLRAGSAQKVVVRGLRPSEEVELFWLDPSSRVRARWSSTADRQGDVAVEFAPGRLLPGTHRVVALRRGDAPSVSGAFLAVPAELPPYLLVLDPDAAVEDQARPRSGPADQEAGERQRELRASLHLAVAGRESRGDELGWVARVLDGGPQFLRLDSDRLAAMALAYARTGSEELLVRPSCLHDRAWLGHVRLWALPRVEAASRRGPLLWSLVRGGFLAEEGGRLDFCRSPHCLHAFAGALIRRHGYLDALNRRWGTAYTGWDGLAPATTARLVGELQRAAAHGLEDFPSGEVAQWSDHRRFLDRTWAETLALSREIVRSEDRRARVGVEGLSLPGIFSGAEPKAVLLALDWASLSADPLCLALARALAPRGFVALTDAAAAHRVSQPSGSESPEAQVEEALWRGVLHGHRGAVVSERVLSGLGASAQRTLRRLSGELGALLERATWEADPVALLYSHPSVQLDWALSAAASSAASRGGRQEPRATWKPWWPGEGVAIAPAGAALAAWAQILSDIGIAARVVHADDLSGRSLGDVAVLVLPRALVLSSREAEVCARFARRGGLLVADSGAGLLDGEFAPARRPILDEVFGIARSGPLRPARPGGDRGGGLAPLRLSGVGKRGAYVDGVDPRALHPVEEGLAAPVGYALAEGPAGVALVTNPFGRGRGAYLNIGLEDYPLQRTGEDGSSIRRLVRNVLELAQVRPRVEVVAEGRPLDGCERSFLRLEETELLLLRLDRALVASQGHAQVQAELVFDGPGYCYDAIAGVLLGSGERIWVTLEPGRLSVFARLPYDVDGISIRAEERAGNRVRFRAVVETTTDLAWTHVLGQELLSSDGRTVPGTRATLLARRGVAWGEIEFAPNEPAGEYRLVLRDAATGVTGEITLTKRPDDLEARWPLGGGSTSAGTPDSGGSPGAGSASP